MADTARTRLAERQLERLQHQSARHHGTYDTQSMAKGEAFAQDEDADERDAYHVQALPHCVEHDEVFHGANGHAKEKRERHVAEHAYYKVESASVSGIPLQRKLGGHFDADERQEPTDELVHAASTYDAAILFGAFIFETNISEPRVEKSTMSDPFAKIAREQFVDYASMFVDFLAEIFPEDEACKDAVIFLNSVVKNSQSHIDNQHTAWMKNIKTPLNPKKTKYAKAVERITNEPSVLFHAIMYKDIETCTTTLHSPFCATLQIFDKYADERMTDEHKTAVWKFIEKLSLAAYEAASETPPTVPTRLEIQENIKSRKEKPAQDDGPSMTRAFQTHMSALYRILDLPDEMTSASDGVIRAEMMKWNEFAKSETSGERNSKLCQESNPIVIVPLVETFPTLEKLKTLSKIDDKIWRNINQLNGFSAVSENIPTKMMTRIEDVANKLADDIVAGRTDMSSVNLSDIGQQVLAGCDESDMTKFASNIEELLPALQSFHQN